MKIKSRAAKSLKDFIAILLLALFSSDSVMSAITACSASLQNKAEWERVMAKDDNFSVLMPVQPEITRRAEFNLDGERVTQELRTVAYHDGVVYSVYMYESSNPQRLLSVRIADLSIANESNVTVGGIVGKDYLINRGASCYFIRLFPTKKHLYVLEAAARSENNRDVRRFLSSVTLGNAVGAEMITSSDQSPNEVLMPVAPAGTEPLTEKEVTKPAIIVSMPRPSYPFSARQKRLGGKVKVQVVLSQFGEAKVVRVLGGPNELTEDTIKAAEAMKFLPAIKDGRLVPQIRELEYDFVAH